MRSRLVPVIILVLILLGVGTLLLWRTGRLDFTPERKDQPQQSQDQANGTDQQPPQNGNTQVPGDQTRVPVIAEYSNKVVYTTDMSVNRAPLEQDCRERDGRFDECGSVCGPDAEVCVDVCAYVCHLGDEDEATTTVQWIEYQNEQMGFEVSYPKQARIQEIPEQNSVSIVHWGPTQREGTEFFDGYTVTFQEITLEGRQTVDEYIEQETESALFLGEVTEPVRETIFAGQRAFTFATRTLGELNYIVIPQGRSQVFQITYRSPDPTNQGFAQIVERILQSFQFTNQANISA